MLAAHVIPPSAFQNRNVGQGILFIPASHADAIRRPATQRPRKTAFGPWRGEERLAVLEHLEPVRRGAGRGATKTRRPKWRPIAKPTLSPRIAAVAASDGQRDDVHLAPVREQRGADQRGLRRDRDAHRLDRDQGEDERVAHVRRDVDQGGEHVRRTYIVPPPWRSGSSPARARTRCPGFEGTGREPVYDAVGRGAGLARNLGGRRRPAHLAPRRRATRGSPTTSRTAPTSRR